MTPSNFTLNPPGHRLQVFSRGFPELQEATGCQQAVATWPGDFNLTYLTLYRLCPAWPLRK